MVAATVGAAIERSPVGPPIGKSERGMGRERLVTQGGDYKGSYGVRASLPPADILVRSMPHEAQRAPQMIAFSFSAVREMPGRTPGHMREDM